MHKKFTKFQLGSLLSLAVIFLAFLGVYLYFSMAQQGAMIGDTFFSASKEGDSTVYDGSLYEASGTVTMTPEENGATFQFQFFDALSNTSFTGKYQVVFGEETDQGVEVSVIDGNGTPLDPGFRYYQAENDLPLWDENGDPYMDVAIYGTPYNWNEFVPPYYSIISLAAGDNVYHRGHWGLFALISVLGVIAALAVAFPMAFFKFQYSLAVENPEPSEFYRSTFKVECVVFPVLLLLAYLWSLTFAS